MPREKNIRAVVVVSHAAMKYGLRCRKQSGVLAFGDDVPEDVREALAHEYKAGIPVCFIGKSVFHMCDRLMRVVARTGLDMMDADLQRAFTFLRYVSFDEKTLLP